MRPIGEGFPEFKLKDRRSSPKKSPTITFNTKLDSKIKVKAQRPKYKADRSPVNHRHPPIAKKIKSGAFKLSKIAKPADILAQVN